MTKGGAHFGGLTYTRQVPAFLQKMQEQDQDGIAGALKKREGQEEREERSDNEEEHAKRLRFSPASPVCSRQSAACGRHARRF